jgi:Immunity protein 63
MKTLREIETEVNELAARIGASVNDLPSYGQSRDFGYPHIEVSGELYHYVVVERGQEISRQSSANYDDLLYWIFSDATHNLAFDYELNNRIEDQDCRRMAFQKQVQLIRRISPAMADKRSKEIEAILARAPYDDGPLRRAR